MREWPPKCLLLRGGKLNPSLLQMERSPNISWLFHFRIVCEYLSFQNPFIEPLRPTLEDPVLLMGYIWDVTLKA